MSHVAEWVVTCSKPPAIFAISFIFFWVLDAVCPVNERNVFVIVKIIAILVFDISWIETQE
jgi:hypothetical protein